MRAISSFKLHKLGEEGITISATYLSKLIPSAVKDYPELENKIFHDKTETFRSGNVPVHILSAIGKLKHYFLRICGYWLPIFDQYYDSGTKMPMELGDKPKQGLIYLHELWRSVHVTQVKIDMNGFAILGQIEILDGKPLNLNPSRVTPDDMVDYYQQARDQIEIIMRLLYAFFSTMAIGDIESVRKFMLQNADENMKKELSNYSDDQILNRLMDKFSQKGYIIGMDELIEHEIEEPVLDESSPDVELESEPEPESESTEKVPEAPKQQMADYTPPVEKVPNPYGPPAAEKGQAEIVPEEAQYSENPQAPDSDDFV